MRYLSRAGCPSPAVATPNRTEGGPSSGAELRRRRTATIRATLIGLAALTVASCGGSGGSGGAVDQITHNWTIFFSQSSSVQQKVGLLQNGDQFARVIADQARSSLAKQTSAHVSRVSVHGSTADVTYTIDRGSTPVLTGQTGHAVLVHGVWKISERTFCSLVTRGEPAPPPCASTPSSAPSS